MTAAEASTVTAATAASLSEIVVINCSTSSSIEHNRNDDKVGPQCDQTARLFVQYLAIYSNVNFSNSNNLFCQTRLFTLEEQEDFSERFSFIFNWHSKTVKNWTFYCSLSSTNHDFYEKIGCNESGNV